MKFLEEEISKMQGENRNMEAINTIFKEMKPEYLRNSLKKMWL